MKDFEVPKDWVDIAVMAGWPVHSIYDSENRRRAAKIIKAVGPLIELRAKQDRKARS